MTPEMFYRDCFVAISLTVLLTVSTGVVWWIRWFVMSRFFPSRPAPNFSGVRSSDLITRAVQTKPRWTAAEALFMFGLTIILSSLMASIVVRSGNDDQQESIPIDPTAVSLHLSPQSALPTGVTADSQGRTLPSGVADTSSPQNPEPPEESQAVDSLPSDDAQANTDLDSGDASVETESDVAAQVARLPLRVQITIHFIATTLALSLTLIYVRLRRGCTMSQMGMVPSFEDVRQGFRATPWILAPVLAVNVVVSQLVKYEHAVTDMLALDNNFATFAFLMVSAAIVTPIAEEFQFRLLLQGGLQRIADGADLDESPTWTPRAAWPVLVTSVVFAALHLGQGAAPIPLFFLSIGLGYLYQSTGRLTPVIIVHMLLNGATLCMEYCRMNGGITMPGA